MATCRYCGRSGWFLSLSADGLCNACRPPVVRDIVQRKKQVERLVRNVNMRGDFVKKVQDCDNAIRHLTVLEDYERRGIPIRDLSPSSLLAEYRQRREKILFSGIEKLVGDALVRAEVSISVNARIREASKGLLRLESLRNLVRSRKVLDPFETRLKNLIQSTQLSGYLDGARKAEFKGQHKKALDRYRDALYFLSHEEIDEKLKGESVPEVEKKISDLEKTLGART